ncbi:20773_t:CDS:1 [Dentiscutata erythropus]|uniref:20773_t:CDS:1 n=1 Tax=Dentiscutata erythropus TaxID=1348616 RepID=A0A9N8VG74_9GLOM|nr:20773_t:CDS:1 [Dentiscutata erythropus]
MKLIQIEKRLLQKEVQLLQKEELLNKVTQEINMIQLMTESWVPSLISGSFSNDFYNIFPEQQNLLECENPYSLDPSMSLQETISLIGSLLKKIYLIPQPILILAF